MPRTEQPAGSPGLRSLSPSVPTATLQLTCALAWAFGLASGLILGLRTRPSYFAAAFWTGVTRWSRLPPRRAAESPEEQNEERDKDGLYFGTYSTFWSDPSQIIGVIAFSTVLLVFFVGGQRMAREGLSGDPIAVLVALGVVVASGIGWWYFGRRSQPRTPFLNKTLQKLRLAERTDVSHDTLLLRFALDHSDQTLGLPCGMHFKVFCPNPPGKVAGQWNGREDPEAKATEIERKYTPVTGDEVQGHVDLIIKVYKGGVLPQFPDGGKMSQYMGSLKVGDQITVSGPWGLITYNGHGKFRSGKAEVQAKEIGMMAGGTGITPMLQIIKAVLRDPTDATHLSLIYANQSPADILCRTELDALALAHAGRFRLWYTVDRPDDGWAFGTGFITADMIQGHLPGPGPDTVVLLCGPPPMVRFACKENLAKLLYPSTSILTF